MDHDLKFGFWENFIGSVKILHYKQNVCVENGSFTTKYFQLEKHTFQKDHLFRSLSIRSKVFRGLTRTPSDIHDGAFLRK